MEEELDDAGSVAVEVPLIRDRTIPVMPDCLVIVRRVRDAFAS